MERWIPDGRLGPEGARRTNAVRQYLYETQNPRNFNGGRT
jgi:hypothetical protein